MGFEELSPEFQEKAKACKDKEELAELARSIGVKLSDEELEAVAGGFSIGICIRDSACPNRMVPPPCPDKIDCVILSCTELAPCTDLIPFSE